MKLLLNNNYHLLFSPEPITFMTTFKLHKSLLKLVLCGSHLTNKETEKQSKPHGSRSRIQICQCLPPKPMFMPAVLSLIPLSFKYGDRDLLPQNQSPVHDLLPSQTENPSLSPPCFTESEWEIAFICLGTEEVH